MTVQELDCLMKVSEVAAVLGCSERSVWRRIAEGHLRCVHDGGNARIPASSVREYLERLNAKGRV
jgi:excisionase family DNA binding protein